MMPLRARGAYLDAAYRQPHPSSTRRTWPVASSTSRLATAPLMVRKVSGPRALGKSAQRVVLTESPSA
jgi:hypothetical protein